jgi:alanine racemase
MRHSTFLEVDLGILAGNFDLIRELAPKAEPIPMVKANAYGNGIVPVSQFLVRECGVKKLGCATLGEALKIFHESPDLKAQILVFSDSELENEKAREAYSKFNIVPVIHQKSDLDNILKDPSLSRLPLILKLNTGMNRLGFTRENLEEVLPALKNRGVEHLMTHFARSSEVLKPQDKTHRQYDEFLGLKKFLTDSGISIKETSVANSGAIEQQFGVEETYVRPGLMLYGPPSVTDPVLWKGRQCSRWVTKVLTSFSAKKGTPLGYGVNVTDKDSFMIVLPLGYGDGLLTFYSGTRITINGHEGKFFGRINMDMTLIKFDPSIEGKILNNDLVEIWNHDNRVITDLATQMKTHAYQLMCAVSGRIPRIYKVK